MIENLFFFSSRRRHTRWPRDWSSDVCSSDLAAADAARGAHALYTDVWVSMGDDADGRRELLEPFRLAEALMDEAAPEAVALHCLPAHPGDEITEGVLYGERSAVWDQAENRLHAQKALLELLVSR